MLHSGIATSFARVHTPSTIIGFEFLAVLLPLRMLLFVGVVVHQVMYHPVSGQLTFLSSTRLKFSKIRSNKNQLSRRRLTDGPWLLYLTPVSRLTLMTCPGEKCEKNSPRSLPRSHIWERQIIRSIDRKWRSQQPGLCSCLRIKVQTTMPRSPARRLTSFDSGLF